MDDGMEVWNRTERGFGVYELSSISQLFEFVESLQDSSRFVYRGQRDAAWKLETRIERSVPDKYKEIIGVEKLEWDMLFQFRRRAHHYLNVQDLPDLNNLVEWLAVIQHYGGPTRLLDFTRSAFIGTYFAVNDAIDVEEASLWAVNWQYMLMNLQLRLQSNWKDTHDLISRAMLDHSATTKFVVESLDGTNRLAASVIVAPYRQNRRLATQDGVFIVPLDINKPFTENLFESFVRRIFTH